MHTTPRVGIFGYGSFGRFLARTLADHADVSVYDPAVDEYTSDEQLARASGADFVVLAVPLGAYTELLPRIAPALRPESVVVDICSVKTRPVELIRSYLPDQPLVATHPLFGPESAASSLRGHTLVMCPDESSPAPYETIKSFAMDLGLHVVELDASKHDQEVAVIQGLTFFIARGLQGMNLEEYALRTPSFNRLLHLAELEQHHSEALFRTIQTGNPAAMAVRKEFLDHLTRLDGTLQPARPADDRDSEITV